MISYQNRIYRRLLILSSPHTNQTAARDDKVLLLNMKVSVISLLLPIVLLTRRSILSLSVDTLWAARHYVINRIIVQLANHLTGKGATMPIAEQVPIQLFLLLLTIVALRTPRSQYRSVHCHAALLNSSTTFLLATSAIALFSCPYCTCGRNIRVHQTVKTIFV